MQPLVSIITPFYNPGHFFTKTLESLEHLRYENIQFIFVDDGSTDFSSACLESFGRPHKLLSQRNKGVNLLAETLNAGLALADGKYVQMFPSDDIICPEKINSQVSILESHHDVVLVFSNMQLIDSGGNYLQDAFIDKRIKPESSLDEAKLLPILTQNYCIPQPTTLIRKSALLEIGGFIQDPTLFAEDLPTHINLLSVGRFYYQRMCTASYRIHSAQMTSKYAYEMIVTDNLYQIEYFKTRCEVLKEIAMPVIVYTIFYKQVKDLIRLTKRSTATFALNYKSLRLKCYSLSTIVAYFLAIVLICRGACFNLFKIIPKHHRNNSKP